MRRILPLILITCVFTLVFPIQSVFAETYWFSVEQEIVDVYWESDGSMRIEYELVFKNDPSADSPLSKLGSMETQFLGSQDPPTSQRGSRLI